MTVAVTNQLHAVDVYDNLEITTARKTSYSQASDNPQNSQSVQRFRTLTDNVADVV